MPSEAENINYLYLVLTNDGSPVIDWDAVSAPLELNKGAVTKRWSRLKQAMDRNEVPGGTTYQFLWLCVKHHKRTQAPNWNEIAAKANTTAGAASKRYSRMKKVFEENETAPDTGAPQSPVKNTPTKAKAKTTPKSTVKKCQKAITSSGDDQDDAQTTPSTKRKRAPPKKKTAPAEVEVEVKAEAQIKSDAENEDETDKLLETKPKRAKVIPKPKGKAIVKKEEADEDEGESFFDAHEALNQREETEDVNHDSYAVHEPEPADSLDFSGDFV